MLRFSSAGRTHRGLVRDGNEDSAFAGPYLQLVADGVGGHAAGEVASATVGYVVSATAAAHRDDAPLQVLARSVEDAQAQLRAGVAAAPDRHGMGSTLTALLLVGSTCGLVHVGDSRAYLLRDGELTQLTHDHTFVQTLVDAGVLSSDEARRHPQRNVVMQALDGSAGIRPDLLVIELRAGDRLMVCSDGLTDLVEDPAIAHALALPEPAAAADRLVDLALEAGGRDNVTAVVADVEDGPRLVPDGARLGALSDPYLVVDPAAVRAAAG